jgi:hypothetical protein
VRRQHFRIVRQPLPDITPSVFIENGGADLGIPEHLEALALRIVGNAGEADCLQVGSVAAQFLYKPRPAPQMDKAPLPNRLPHGRLHHFLILCQTVTCQTGYGVS